MSKDYEAIYHERLQSYYKDFPALIKFLKAYLSQDRERVSKTKEVYSLMEDLCKEDSRLEMTKYGALNYHAHPIFLAAWNDNKEALRHMLENTPYKQNVYYYRGYVVCIQAYRGWAKNIGDLDIFRDKNLHFRHFQRIAFYAGAGGNQELVASLWLEDERLLREAYNGAVAKNHKRMIEYIEKRCLPLKLEKKDWEKTFICLFLFVIMIKLVLS